MLEIQFISESQIQRRTAQEQPPQEDTALDNIWYWDQSNLTINTADSTEHVAIHLSST